MSDKENDRKGAILHKWISEQILLKDRVWERKKVK